MTTRRIHCLISMSICQCGNAKDHFANVNAGPEALTISYF